MNPDQEEEDHPVFRNDPLELKQTLYTCVALSCSDGSTHNGRVIAVDPVSESRILVSDVHSAAPVVEVVFGYSVSSSRTTDTECGDPTRQAVDSLLRRQRTEPALSPAELLARRDHVVSWLRRHRLPVEVGEGHVTVAGVATVRAPYTAEQCVCANELVLQRLDALLKSMPPLEGTAAGGDG
ncbi:uncharacterized protein LOC119105084 isoform X2 [Pollicipes pollicipes]|nr:uncharacterized protein LOC119105084 isoform X2 [Pollicipes pollicipes]XP_037084589.1 uncharacterized protein LOC119105084 isoform X2 [Pollicipes pollicipes]